MVQGGQLYWAFSLQLDLPSLIIKGMTRAYVSEGHHTRNLDFSLDKHGGDKHAFWRKLQLEKFCSTRLNKFHQHRSSINGDILKEISPLMIFKFTNKKSI